MTTSNPQNKQNSSCVNFAPTKSTEILSRLKKVRSIGHGKYMALCPCHPDKNPSLAITFNPDGVVLMHCFGCGASGPSVCDALGLEVSLLFPESSNNHYQKKPSQGFSTWQILHGIKNDLPALLIAARTLSRGESLPEEDIQYLSSVALRVNDAIKHLGE